MEKFMENSFGFQSSSILKTMLETTEAHQTSTGRANASTVITNAVSHDRLTSEIERRSVLKTPRRSITATGAANESKTAMTAPASKKPAMPMMIAITTVIETPMMTGQRPRKAESAARR